MIRCPTASPSGICAARADSAPDSAEHSIRAAPSRDSMLAAGYPSARGQHALHIAPPRKGRLQLARDKETTMADQQRDVIEVLEHDHREVEEMFAELESLRGAASDEAKARRKDLADQVTIELVRHSVAEEVLVYPQVEKKVSAEEAERARKEHAEAEETLHRMEKLDADDPAFDDELATLMVEIREHIAEEEGEMFAHMRQVIDEDELRKLGGRVQAFKKVAPTRPHPHVPNEPLARMAAGPAASLFDRMRDLHPGRGPGDGRRRPAASRVASAAESGRRWRAGSAAIARDCLHAGRPPPGRRR